MRVIVLDLDDTLYLERDYAYSGFRAVGHWVESQFGPTGFGDHCRSLFDSGVRGTVFNQALQRFELSRDELIVRQLLTVYRTHYPAIQLLPDSLEFLRKWRDSSFVALISDGPLVAQRQKVRALDLEKWLDLCVLTDVWGKPYWKPCLRAYQEVQHYFRAEPRQCVYVADNPKKDFIACHQLGWRSVRLRRRHGLHGRATATADRGADHEICTLDEMNQGLIHSVGAAA